MKLKNHLVLTSLGALAAWLPLATAQELTRHETRSGVLEFEANGYVDNTAVFHVMNAVFANEHRAGKAAPRRAP